MSLTPAPNRSENLALSGAVGSDGGGGYGGLPAFLSAAQKRKLATLAQLRLLYEGRHEEYFLAGERSEFHFPWVKANGRLTRMYQVHNLLGLMSVKTASLLFGEAPLIDAADERQLEALRAIMDRSGLQALLLEAAMRCSAEGEAFLEAIIAPEDGRVYICHVPNDEIFVDGDLKTDGQPQAFVRINVKNLGSEQEPRWSLLETRIEAGMIRRQAVMLTRGLQRGARVALETFDPALAGMDETPTGIDRPTVVWVTNSHRQAVSDYHAAAISAQDRLNAKETQIARVLARHSDPKLAAPQSAANEQGNVAADADLHFYRSRDEIPQYIVWNAELTAAMADRDKAEESLIVTTEMSPTILGISRGAAPETYKKTRLASFNPLSKAARKALGWNVALRQILEVAQALDNTRPSVIAAGGYPHGERSPVSVSLRDGIPADEESEANEIATLRAAGVLSRFRAVQRQLGNAGAANEELKWLDEEAQAAMPSVLLGGKADGRGL